MKPGNAGRPAIRRPPHRRMRGIEQRAKRMLLPAAARLFPARRAARGAPLEAARAILVVRQDNRLGNLLLLTPFLRVLRQLAPAARIGLLTGDAYGPWLAGAPWFDELLLERKRWLIRHPYAYPSYLRAIRRGGWEWAFELSNADTHSFNNCFLTQVSGAPQRVGFDHPRSRPALSRAILPPPPALHYARAALCLLAALAGDAGWRRVVLPETLSTPPALAQVFATARPPQPDRLLVHPGGRGAKRWPEDKFAALINALGEDLGVDRLLIVGGPAEAALLARLSALLGGRIATRLCPSLPALVEALSSARLYVGCDAGPLHLAAALGLPTISLWLSSHPGRYAPLGALHRGLILGAGSRRWLARTAVTPPPPPPSPRAEVARLSVVAPERLAQIAAPRPRLCDLTAAGGEDLVLRVRDEVRRLWIKAVRS